MLNSNYLPAMISLRIFRIELSPALLLGFCLSALTLPVFGQNAAKHWAVGRAGGVNFATNPPTASLATAATYEPGEGGASISDANGNLLFYTDGTQIFTNQHEVMAGSANLGGHVSSSQSALIVRQPGSQRYYYVFTTDAIESFPTAHQGLRYTLVDVQAPSGHADIVAGQKSVLLATSTTEKLTACAAADGQSVWIVGHEFGTARFLAWKLTSTGLASTTPVYSTAGTAHGTAGSGNYNPGRGCMKASPDGSLLASVILPPVGDRYVAQVFRFNNATGQASLLVDLSEPANGANDYNFYGVEFSPSASRLYISTRKGPYNILQYDLCAGNVAGSKTIVGTSTNQFGTLQLGPDGKLYCAKNSDQYIGVIQNPEGAGTACTYRDQGFNLTGRTSTYGLNNLSASLFYRSRLAVTGASGCQGQPLAFSASAQSCGLAQPPLLSYGWNFSDAGSGAANTATGLTASHSFTHGGTYRVRLTGAWGEANDTASVLVRVEAKPVGVVAALDSNWCQGSRGITLSLQGTSGSTPTVWAQPGGAASSLQTSPGHLDVHTGGNGNAWVRYVVRSSGGCPGDTQRIAWQVNQQPAPAVTGPADVCLGAAATYLPSVAGSYVYVYDGQAAAASSQTYSILTSASAGAHSLHIAGGLSGQNRTCYTDGPDLAITIRENADLQILNWDSAFCPDAPGSRYQIAVTDALRDSVRWTVTGDPNFNESKADVRQLSWLSGQQGHVTVQAQTTPGCPRRQFSTEVKERCLEVMNLVTANADGKNDNLYIRNLESYPGAEVAVYSRQGHQVLSTVAQNNADLAGADLPGGTYFYLVKYRAGGNWQQKKGWVEVVR